MQFPYRIENRSSQYDVVFSQVGAKAEEEWVIPPLCFQQFIYPDPDSPKQLVGRIRYSGSAGMVKYDLEDISKQHQLPLIYLYQMINKL